MKKLYFILMFIPIGVFAQPGNLCTNPIVIASLPYTASDDTANYGDNYDPQTTTHPDCNGTSYGNYYHGGNDVIYSYTPTSSGLVKFELPNVIAWTGMFIYTDCANIGITYAGCSKSSQAGTRTIDNFAVTAGQTYFILISSWPAPQTFAYTLNVTNLTLGTTEVQQAKGLKIYPNPVTNILNLETNVAIRNVTIVTVNGQRFEAKLLNNNQINVENLQTGFYILEVTSEDGAKIYKNFIKG